MKYIYLLPLAACIVVFLFSTAGFFANTKEKEMVYGACSIASAVCVIVQLAILL